MPVERLRRDWAARSARADVPVIGHLDLTYRCNLKCIHCYVVAENRTELSLAEIKRVLAQLAEAGTLYLNLSGGEIFTREDVFEIAEYARSLHFALWLLTNGTLIDEEKAERIARLCPDQVSVSIYGPDAATHDAVTAAAGSFEKTTGAVKLLRARKVRVKMKQVLMRQNVHSYRRTRELARSLGASFSADPTITPSVDGDKRPLKYRISEEELARVMADPLFLGSSEPWPVEGPGGQVAGFPCGAAHNSVYVSPYGDVFACPQLPVSCGNVRESAFSEIWHSSPQMLEVRAATASRLPACLECEDFKRCRRCPGLAYLENGDYNTTSELTCLEARIRGALPVQM